jgi:hypothetical protein
MKKDSYFVYNDGNDATNGAFRISASKVSDFFDSTSKWYHEHLLGEGGFTGNTASCLGTAVHAGIEIFVKEGEVDYDAIEAYINSLNDPEVDNNEILNNYGCMLDVALSYVENNMPDVVEEFVYHELLPGIVVGGSIDARYTAKRRIKDWKTTSAKTAPTRFSRNYWFQQMTYCWVLKQKGVDIDYIDLVFITKGETGRVSEKTGKPLKDYPSAVSVVTEEVTEEKLELIGSCLKLIAESVQMWHNKPELRHLLAQDMRLKPKPGPIRFK